MPDSLMADRIVEERARRAGDRKIKHDTYIPLIDINPKTVAEFLAPKPWSARAKYLENIITDSLRVLSCILEKFEKPKNTEFMDLCLQGMREQITAVLDHLERLAPLLPDVEALRIWRVSDDPERVAYAVATWGDEDAELRALRPRSSFMILRNLAKLGSKAVRPIIDAERSQSEGQATAGETPIEKMAREKAVHNAAVELYCQWLDAHKAIRAQEAAMKRAPDSAEAQRPHERRLAMLCKKRSSIEQEIGSTPATSAAGILAKLEITAFYMQEFRKSDAENVLALSAKQDLVSMWGQLVSPPL